jgi:hypothetical protein
MTWLKKALQRAGAWAVCLLLVLYYLARDLYRAARRAIAGRR